MSQTMISSREFNQNVSAAEKAAANGPVVVTEDGKPVFVLMTHAEFRRLTGQRGQSIVELLRDPESADIEFDPPKLGAGLVRPADFGLMYLAGTNVISELRRPERANPRVVQWMAAADAASLYLSVISVLELERGALSIARRDAAQGALLMRWIAQRVLPAFAERILPVDLPVARRAAGLHVPDPRPERDCLLAATALVHGLAVITRNRKDFEPMGVRVIDPWEV